MRAGKNLHALVLGYIGYQNTGDELLLRVMNKAIACHDIPIELDVLTRDPAATARVHGVCCPVHEPFGGHKRPSLVTRWRRFRAIAKTDLLLVGPGGFLQDYDTHGVRSMFGAFRAVLLARWSGARAVGVGLGAGPLVKPWGRRFARWICGLCDMLLVRDTDSLVLLRDLGVCEKKMRLVADLAFARCWEPREGAPRDRKVLGVSIFDFYGYITGQNDKTRAGRQAFARCLDAVAEKGYAIAFVSMQGAFGGHDEKEGEAIRALMEHKESATVLPYQEDPEETLRLIGNCDWFLGMRLHSVIMALAAGVPFAAISYHPKVASLMDELGLSDLMLSLEELEEAKLGRLIERLLARNELGHALLKQREELAQRAEKAFVLLREYCQATFS